MNTGYWLALAIYLYAGWAFGEIADHAFSRKAVRIVAYVALFVAWPLLMPWVPRYGLKRLRNKTGANDK